MEAARFATGISRAEHRGRSDSDRRGGRHWPSETGGLGAPRARRGRPASAAPGPSPTVGCHRVVPEGPWASASSPGFFRSPEPGARPMTESGEGSLVKRRRETLKNRKLRGWEKNQPAPLRVHENRLPLCRGRCRHLGALCAPKSPKFPRGGLREARATTGSGLRHRRPHGHR